MAQRSSRKRRKERQRAAAREPGNGAPTAEGDSDSDRMARGYARGRLKDEAARAALVPLAPGERPRAVTIAGAVAAFLGLANLIAFLAGMEVRGEQPSAVGVGLFTFIMLAAAIGCFRVRYWAVLGMQALLALAILIFSLLLIRAESLLAVVIAVAVIGGAGALFWFLVKSMARIQMPQRPGA